MAGKSSGPPARVTNAGVNCIQFHFLIASRNGRYSAFGETAALATLLGAKLVDAGFPGRIGESGHGPWPEGLMQLAAFLKTL
jgi:uncharacterized protein